VQSQLLLSLVLELERVYALPPYPTIYLILSVFAMENQGSYARYDGMLAISSAPIDESYDDAKSIELLEKMLFVKKKIPSGIIS